MAYVYKKGDEIKGPTYNMRVTCISNKQYIWNVYQRVQWSTTIVEFEVPDYNIFVKPAWA